MEQTTQGEPSNGRFLQPNLENIRGASVTVLSCFRKRCPIVLLEPDEVSVASCGRWRGSATLKIVPSGSDERACYQADLPRFYARLKSGAESAKIVLARCSEVSLRGRSIPKWFFMRRHLYTSPDDSPLSRRSRIFGLRHRYAA